MININKEKRKMCTTTENVPSNNLRTIFQSWKRASDGGYQKAAGLGIDIQTSEVNISSLLHP